MCRQACLRVLCTGHSCPQTGQAKRLSTVDYSGPVSQDKKWVSLSKRRLERVAAMDRAYPIRASWLGALVYIRRTST